MAVSKQQLFGNIDFLTILQHPDFKEDSVREVIILPILKLLGYDQQNIIRGKTLQHPFLKVGSNKKIPIKLVPDYLLKIENSYAWVLDVKAPNQKIVNDENVEQVYSYAMHPEIRSAYFALCNGVEFSLFKNVTNYVESDLTTKNTKAPPPYPIQRRGISQRTQEDADWYNTRPLLLCFSGLVTRANLTFHTTSRATDANISGGDAAAFRYYRYRIAPNPREIDLMKYFELRYQKVKAAKEEMEYFINENTIGNVQILKGTATDLSFLSKESVDYIYTDPPYGKKIPYLDLSVMWNAWLDLDVTEEDFKKRQNPFTVLSGQLIINFRKVRNPRTIMKANLGMNIGEIVIQTIEGIVAKQNGATLEQINDELIIKGLELGFLDLLKKEYSDLTPILMSSFDYDAETELFTIKKDTKFTAQIPLELRIRYYLTSYLRRMERENRVATFDEIVLHILPLLKNGLTPEDQTILTVLETIGERIGQNSWILKKEGQRTLFE